MPLADTLQRKPGDILKSDDWNVIIKEVDRLERAKINRDGADTLKGPLTIAGALNADSNVTVKGSLNIVASPQDSTGQILVLGPTNASNLRLGYHQDYSWIQSHGNKPLLINSSNNVGIGGTVNPIAKLDISAASRTGTHPTAVKGLYVTGDFSPDSDGVEFRHSNGTSGIGFGHNTIYAAGSNANQDLGLKPKGTGRVTVFGGLSVDGNLSISRLSVREGVIQRGGEPITTTTDLGLYSQISGACMRFVTNDAPFQFFSGGGIGTNAIMTLNPSGNLSVSGNLSASGNLSVSGNLGIGINNPIAKLDISAASRTGTHPTAVKGLYVTGDFNIDSDGVEFRHSNGTQGIGFGFNTIYAAGSNANQDLGLKPKGTGRVTVSGSLSATGSVSFGPGGRQMLNLFETSYGIGIQSATQYFRTGANFAWYKGGSHNDAELNAGGGTSLMTLNSSGNLSVSGQINVSGNLSVANVLEIGDKPPSGNAGGHREWMQKGIKLLWDTDSLFIGLKNEGENRKDAVIAWGDDPADDLRFISVVSNGDVQGNEAMRIKPSGNVGIGINNPIAKLDISAASRTGTHPTAVKGLYVTGDFNIDSDGVEFRHSNGTSGIGFGHNTIYAAGSNANQDLGLKPKGTGEVKVSGNLSVTGSVSFGSLSATGSVSFGSLSTTGSLSFGSQTRQMLNLFSTEYGIGIQSATQYFRTGANFAWYKGGSHNDAELNAGGGTSLMNLNSSGNLSISGNLSATGSVSFGGNLSTSRLSVSGGVIQRGGEPITATSDLGLYSQISSSWMRFVTNGAPFKFFSDGGTGAEKGIGTNAIMTLEPKGDLLLSGGNFSITNNGNTFTIQVEENRVIFKLSKTQQGPNKTMGWAGINWWWW